MFVVLEQREVSAQLGDRRHFAAALVCLPMALAVASSIANMDAAYTNSVMRMLQPRTINCDRREFAGLATPARFDANLSILCRHEEWQFCEWKATVRIHDLRHTYASVFASSGFSLPIIGALLGQSQVATTVRYAHLLDDPLRAATECVEVIVNAAVKNQ